MDKTDRALLLAEDNASAVNALYSRLPQRRVLTSAAKDGKTSFGSLACTFPVAAVVAFGGAACSLEYCGKTVASGVSPIIAVLPIGNGELRLDGLRNNACALII